MLLGGGWELERCGADEEPQTQTPALYTTQTPLRSSGLIHVMSPPLCSHTLLIPHRLHQSPASALSGHPSLLSPTSYSVQHSLPPPRGSSGFCPLTQYGSYPWRLVATMFSSLALSTSLINARPYGSKKASPCSHPPKVPSRHWLGLGRMGEPDLGGRHQQGACGQWAEDSDWERPVRALGWEPREGKRKADSPHLSQPASTFSSGVHWALWGNSLGSLGTG